MPESRRPQDPQHHLRHATALLTRAEQHLAKTRLKGKLTESNLGMGHFHFQCTMYYLNTALRAADDAARDDS